LRKGLAKEKGEDEFKTMPETTRDDKGADELDRTAFRNGGLMQGEGTTPSKKEKSREDVPLKDYGKKSRSEGKEKMQPNFVTKRRVAVEGHGRDENTLPGEDVHNGGKKKLTAIPSQERLGRETKWDSERKFTIKTLQYDLGPTLSGRGYAVITERNL